MEISQCRHSIVYIPGIVLYLRYQCTCILFESGCGSGINTSYTLNYLNLLYIIELSRQLNSVLSCGVVKLRPGEVLGSISHHQMMEISQPNFMLCYKMIFYNMTHELCGKCVKSINYYLMNDYQIIWHNHKFYACWIFVSKIMGFTLPPAPVPNYLISAEVLIRI